MGRLKSREVLMPSTEYYAEVTAEELRSLRRAMFGGTCLRGNVDLMRELYHALKETNNPAVYSMVQSLYDRAGILEQGFKLLDQLQTPVDEGDDDREVRKAC